ncbi:ABC transporter substrate-binding protein [Streptomyces sp. NPDC090106]|uniref:ABC transporter substrate-binding protein n=1 Tax=Streptomyces sp. NPDC090106 TaxID=3365946 RepID=UPI00381B8722
MSGIRMRRRHVRVVTALGVCVATMVAAGCSGGSGASGSASGSEAFRYLSADTNTQIRDVLKIAAGNQCKAENAAQKLTVTTTPGTTVDQTLQLQAGQNALSTMTTASGTPSLMKDFIKTGKLVNVTKALGDGSSDILPAAQSVITELYGTEDSYVMPTEFNIEGVWYNKKIFAEHGIEVPTTWDDFVAASDRLQKAGVQPMATDGKDGWTITRLVSNYLYRTLGVDALKDVSEGKAKLTDDAYVEAAKAVADYGKAGYFGKSPSSIDYNTMESLFGTGQAAMMYNGSWTLSNFADENATTIGKSNIGFFPFPAVAGGKGSIDDTPSNIGIPVMFAQSAYGSNTQAWMKCIAANYGNIALANGGVVSGFKVTEVPDDLDPLTKLVQERVAGISQSVLWFEALFSAKQTTTSQQKAAQLATGSVSPEQFMQSVQNAG